tara:strand:- start:93 stop:356 length:264 start_codon:yes stop_codon:yes gene_type:complete
MAEEEATTPAATAEPKAVYRNEDVDYDVSKLNQEGQQAFMMLAQLQQNDLRKVELELGHLRAAQAQYNSIIKDNLDEEAKIPTPESN